MKNCATLAAPGDRRDSPADDGLRKKLPQANSAVANSTSHGTRRAKIDGGVARRMSAPRAPPIRLIANSLRIVSPVGVPASARPVKPVTSCAGNSATVEVMLAARASIPVSINDGRVTNDPPPASAFCTPAHIAATKRMMRERIIGFGLGSRAPAQSPTAEVGGCPSSENGLRRDPPPTSLEAKVDQDLRTRRSSRRAADAFLCDARH
jgi:hypothetical protein